MAATPGMPAWNHVVLKWQVNAPVMPLTSQAGLSGDAPRNPTVAKIQTTKPPPIASMAMGAPRPGSHR